MFKQIFALAFLVMVFGCKSQLDIDDSSAVPSENISMKFSNAQFPILSETISKVNGYVMLDGIFYKSFTDIVVDQTGSFSLNIPRKSTVYFTTNLDETSALSSLEPGVDTLADFLSLTTNATATHADNRAPEFFSGFYTPIAGDAGAQNIELCRSNARLDFDLMRDNKIKVSRIVVSDASPYTLLFKGDVPMSYGKTAVYDKSYTPNLNAAVVEDLFRIYESNTPVKVTIYGSYNDVPTLLVVSLPSVQRNKVYKINILNNGNTIDGSFSILPWENGGEIDANPELNSVTIDPVSSIFPSSTVVDYDNNKVQVTAQGADFTLALKSAASVQVLSVEGSNQNFSYTAIGSETVADGVITKYNVKVNPQTDGRLGYVVKLNLKNDLLQNTYDQLVVNVAPSTNQIPVVTIGGVTWMAFNASTPNLEDQLYLPEGVTVKDAYDDNWIEYIGGLFQWGRQYKYTPWLGVVTNAGNQDRDTPTWNSRTHSPCPAGFRVPSETELRALIPNLLTMPSVHTYNGETITTELHTSKNSAVSIAGVTGKARYFSFTSDKGSVLYIPLVGLKSLNSTAASPNLGSGFMLWTAEYAGKFPTVDYSWVAGWTPSGGVNATTGTVVDRGKIPSDAYASVRCIKE